MPSTSAAAGVKHNGQRESLGWNSLTAKTKEGTERGGRSEQVRDDMHLAHHHQHYLQKSVASSPDGRVK